MTLMRPDANGIWRLHCLRPAQMETAVVVSDKTKKEVSYAQAL